MDKELYLKNLKDYLHLLSLYFNKQEAPEFKIDDSNISFFINLSKKHSLTALFYKVVKDTKVDIKEEYLKKLEEYYLSNLRKHVLFEQERKELIILIHTLESSRITISFSVTIKTKRLKSSSLIGAIK